MTLGVAAMALGFSSCVNDLDLQPVDPSQKTDISNDMDAVFADVYFNFATYGANGNSPVHDFDGGMATFQRALFIAEEMPTDEACWLYDPSDYGTINYGYATTSVGCLFGFYSRLIINITLCNQFIQNVNDGVFHLPTDADRARAQEYMRQARILRGACYFYLLTLYNNPPYADESTPIGAEPTQPGRDKVYDYVTSDLEDIVAYYNENEPNQKPYYGFVGLDVAESLLAKLYLNGEVFAGRADYDKCYKHCQAVINRLGHSGYYGNGLARSYQALFGHNNDKYVLGNAGSDVNEIIWTIPQSYNPPVQNLTSYANSTFMIMAWVGSSGAEGPVAFPTMDPDYKNKTGEDLVADVDGVQRLLVYCATQDDFDKAKAEFDDKTSGKNAWKGVVAEVIDHTPYAFNPNVPNVLPAWYNVNDKWQCMVARRSFVRKFEWLDDMMTESNDTRVHWWQTYKHGFASENPTLVGDDWGNNGYLAIKYSNWDYNDDGSINYTSSPDPTGQAGGDYAMIRLAEVYLMAAEAILQGGGGTEAEALKYVNYIRQRAYGDKFQAWGSLNMTDLQNERQRELYTELTRRTDLIRWNLWCSGYTWEWKGGIPNGTNLGEYTKSYPIPSRVITSSSLKQIAGY